MAAKALRTPVLIAHDSGAQYATSGNMNPVEIAGDGSEGLFGLFRAAGAVPDVAFLDHMKLEELKRTKSSCGNRRGTCPRPRARSSRGTYGAAGRWFGSGARTVVSTRAFTRTSSRR